MMINNLTREDDMVKYYGFNKSSDGWYLEAVMYDGKVNIVLHGNYKHIAEECKKLNKLISERKG
jgi:regulation of enolase protein 1 (concanavalin A-like superfamily)